MMQRDLRQKRSIAVPLTRLIERCFHDFTKNTSAAWLGREREAISLYAFRYLINRCGPRSCIKPDQIGIEVAVPQLNTHARHKEQVCKDLVIWRNGGDTARTAPDGPAAVLEWTHGDEPRPRDIAWLRRFTSRFPRCIGYAIAFAKRDGALKLKWVRIRSGRAGRMRHADGPPPESRRKRMD